MGAPEIILLVLLVMSWTIALVKDGETRKYGAGAATLGIVLEVALLWWGGFFA